MAGGDNSNLMIYIIELDEPIGNRDNCHGSARYYIGYCDDDHLEQRIAQHRSGQGARMLAACNERGIEYNVILILPGDRTEERRLKNQKNTPRLVRKLKGSTVDATRH